MRRGGNWRFWNLLSIEGGHDGLHHRWTKALYADGRMATGDSNRGQADGPAIGRGWASDPACRPWSAAPIALPPPSSAILPRARQRKHSATATGLAPYYQQQKDRGPKAPHHQPRTRLQVGSGILLRCWHDHTPYDDALYMRSLKDRNPALYQLALTTKLPARRKNRHESHFFHLPVHLRYFWVGPFLTHIGNPVPAVMVGEDRNQDLQPSISFRRDHDQRHRC